MSGFITPPTVLMLSTGQTYRGTVLLHSGAGMEYIDAPGGITANATGATDYRTGSVTRDIVGTDPWTPYIATGLTGSLESLTIMCNDATRLACFWDEDGHGAFRAIFRNASTGVIIPGPFSFQLWWQATGPIS